MQETTTLSKLSALQTAVLKCIVYSDLFDFPLTAEEIHHWLSVPASLEDVTGALHSDPLASMLTHAGAFVTLRGREPVVALRVHRRDTSAIQQRKAVRYGSLIARLPFVRMVAITGSLAADNADEDDDLDYLIVTAPGRVWLTRTMIMAIGRIAALRGVTLCPNYLLAETALALGEHDFYTARELLQMRVVAGQATYQRMLDENAWWRTFLPNVVLEGSVGAMHASPLRNLRRLIEAVLRMPPSDVLERWVYRRKAAELRRTAGGPEAVYDETMCKGHSDAWKHRTQRRLEERMRQLLEGAS